MNKRVGEDPRERRAELDAHGAYSRMLFDALTTSDALVGSWRRPKRHNRAIERDALFCSLLLDADCRAALADGSAIPSAMVASAETRYEVHAAIQTVHVVLPFTLAERDVLTSPEMVRNPRFEDESAVPDTGLLERWHEWLWMDELGVPQTSTEALGASAILQEGCRRLSMSLPKVMGGMGLLLAHSTSASGIGPKGNAHVAHAGS
jgi:hypothetical protein